MTTSVFDRYSNTLLVSLNNRISLRDRSVSSSGRRIDRSPPESFPTNTPSEATMEIPLTDMHKASDPLKIPPLGGLGVHERVISESLARLLGIVSCLEQFARLRTSRD